MAKSEKIKSLEKQIAEGLKPPCPECGSRLDIEELAGNTGSKGYSYSCLKKGNNPECPLPAGMAYVPPHFVIWQAMQQKFVQIALIAVASVALVGAGGNVLGVFDFKIGEEKSKPADQKTGNNDGSVEDSLAIASLEQEVSNLKKQLEEARKPTTENRPEEEQILIWESELRRGFDRYEKPPREYNKSKRYLFSALEKYNQNEERYSLGQEQRSRIMEILADLIWKSDFSDEELEKFIYYADKQKYSPAGRRPHHLGIAYYHLSEQDQNRELELKSLSFLNYLTFLKFLIPSNTGTDYESATLNAIKEVLPAMNDSFRLMRNQDKLPPAWNRRSMVKIEKAVENRDANSIAVDLQHLEDHVVEQGWGKGI